jgi:glycosyltransferase involved in cell wall biosynthesis
MNVAIVVADPSLGPDVPFGDSMRLQLLRSAIEGLGHDVQMLWADVHHAGPAVTRPRRVPSRARPLLRDMRTLIRARRFTSELADVRRPDLVLEFATYLAPVGLGLARRLDVPYVVEVEGPLAALRYEDGRSPLRALGDRQLARQLHAASAVLTVSEPLAHHLVELGSTSEQTVVAPNVADTDVFRPDMAGRANTRAALEIGPETIVFGFHGVFSPWYSLPHLVRAAAETSLPNVCVLLIGDGVDRTVIESTARELGTRVIVTGFVPQARAADLVQAIDVGVVPDHAWWTSPLKLFELGAVGKAVLAAGVPSVTSVARTDEVAMFDPDDEGALARELDALGRHASRREALADKWHARVLRDYTLPALQANVARALELAIT